MRGITRGRRRSILSLLGLMVTGWLRLGFLFNPVIESIPSASQGKSESTSISRSADIESSLMPTSMERGMGGGKDLGVERIGGGGDAELEHFKY